MRSDNRATKLEDEWNEHGFVENLNLPAREEQLIWHVLEGASTLDIKKHFQRYLNEQNPELFDERIIFMSVRREIQTSVCTVPKKCSICDKSQARTQPASEKTWWNGGPNKPQGQWTVRCRWLTCSKCHSPHSEFPATEPLSLGKLKKLRINYHFQGTT